MKTQRKFNSFIRIIQNNLKIAKKHFSKSGELEQSKTRLRLARKYTEELLEAIDY